MHRLFRDGQSILVAVSGGLDSMVLLDTLHSLSRSRGWRLVVAHLNHQLRGRASDADARLVRRTAARLGLPVVVERADVRGLANEQKISLEMAARRLRQDFLARAAEERGIPSVALAHHADDQVELVFLRLLRGTGTEGLGGMKWRNPSPRERSIELVRPLLDLSKVQLHEEAVRRGIDFREDASNRSLDIQRNRLRHQVLPLLRKRFQPALNRAVLRMSDTVGAEGEFITRCAREWLARTRPARGTEAPPDFDKLPLALQRRCLYVQLLDLGLQPDFDLVEHLRLRGGAAVAVSTKATEGSSPRSKGLLRPVSEPPPHPPFGHPLPLRGGEGRGEGAVQGGNARICSGNPLHVYRDASGKIKVRTAQPAKFRKECMVVHLSEPGGEVVFDMVRIRWRFLGKTGNRLPKKQRGQEYFDAERIGSPVWLRHWQPGDKFQPIGMKQAVKLQDFFTNLRIPRFERHRALIALTACQEIFWVEGARISERFKLSNLTIRRLQWCWERL